MRHLIAKPAITALLIGATATTITVGAPAAAAAPAAPAATAATGDRAHHAPLPPSSHRKGRKAVRRGKKRKQPPQSSFMLMRSKSGADHRRDTDKTTLYCEPAGGDHPKAAQACRDLLASKGGFQLPAGDSICPMMHAPVTVQAIGLWRGTVKRFSATYGNECQMRSRTGAIFGY